LRLLKIVAYHALELKEDLQEELAQTPTQPWKNVIPQLFCRLNHAESYVRKSISELLCRIAKDLPHLIIYPAVVGSQDGPTKIETVHSTNEKSIFENENSKSQDKKSVTQQKLTDAQSENLSSEEEIVSEADENSLTENDPDQELDIANKNQPDAEQDNPDVENEDEEEDEEKAIMHEEKKVELKNNYKYLLDTLLSSNPKMIEQVKLFVNEMRRITLLREELWYGTLNQIHTDLDKRMEQLTLEMGKLKANQSLGVNEKNSIAKEKYEILLQPIVSILEHVNEITTKLDAETPNEEQFQVKIHRKFEISIFLN
jgi:serine/threonine-protein kinase SMG1